MKNTAFGAGKRLQQHGYIKNTVAESAVTMGTCVTSVNNGQNSFSQSNIRAKSAEQYSQRSAVIRALLFAASHALKSMNAGKSIRQRDTNNT